MSDMWSASLVLDGSVNGTPDIYKLEGLQSVQYQI